MASSSLSSPSAPTFSSQPWKYHVFLSFRGEDTRKTFVDHLYSVLEQRGIYTYKDDEKLRRGESIGPSLLKAIEESQIAVIIFSENYADSSWCLDELACIMKCKDTKGQIVMPIFYRVDPSELRKQKRKYGEAFAKFELENKKKVKSLKQAIVDDPLGWLFAPREQKRKYSEDRAKHELENKTKLESWRKALLDASNLSGWEVKHIANGHESKVIKEIVDTISQSLRLVTSSENENLIGLGTRMQCLRSELKVGLGGVRMIGIWGVGGGGKTTLASSIYDEISGLFDGSCFVKNIREESSKNGLIKLQEKILFGILKETNAKVIGRVEEGMHFLKDRLCHRKVLIVLDDVDRLDQLKALAGSHDWFGEGSRIIITTRDRHLLNAHRVDVMHNISLLDYDEAIRLFRKLSPQDYRPKEDYERLSENVVSYAGGLPLALTVLGSFLCDKDIDEWISALARLKEIPNDDIVGKLKISFDGLTKDEKELFLDIACFFRREKKDKTMTILDACGFHPVIGVKVLIQKALITISEEGEFDMHDLVQEMGHHIVRGEHPKNPEKHSRVWKAEDVMKICARDATTELDKIEAIAVNVIVKNYLVQDFPPIVAKIKNLRSINWRGYLASPLLDNLPPLELCCLMLDGYSQKQLWKGYKSLPNLKMMELRSVENLMVTPDFDGLPNLERFLLHGCLRIEEIHPSIGHLERLVFLSINKCPSLKKFPPTTQLKKLETLILSDCPELLKLSEIQQKTENLPHLDLDTSGKEGASSNNFRTNIAVTEVNKPVEDLIDVEECYLEEPSFPHKNMNHHTGLGFFPRGLRKLHLWYCNLGDKDIGSAVWELPNLEELNLAGNKFSRLNFSLLRLPQLKWLNVSGCEKLVELLELPSSIAVLRADWCTSLETFGDTSKCNWLWKVSLQGKNKLGPLVSEILLDSILQGNAIDDHFISVDLEHHKTPERFVGRLIRGKTFRLYLPDGWYNDFCGFLICIVTKTTHPPINIIIRQELDEDSRSELWQKSNEALDPEYDERATFLGYVSFSSMTLSNSSYNIIPFSLESRYWSSLEAESYVGAELIPKKNKWDQVQTTKVAADCSEFWDNKCEDGTTFTVQHESIKILWQCGYYIQKKVIMKVDVHNAKEQRKVLKIVSGLSGIESLAMDMKDKKLTVIGDVDPVMIVTKLRKCWHTYLVSIGPAEGWWKLRRPTILA